MGTRSHGSQKIIYSSLPGSRSRLFEEDSNENTYEDVTGGFLPF
jgi:hypothetical protein